MNIKQIILPFYILLSSITSAQTLKVIDCKGFNGEKIGSRYIFVDKSLSEWFNTQKSDLVMIHSKIASSKS